LTTIRQPVNQMARAAVGILMDHINEPETPAEKRVLSGSLVRGTSTR
jgi:DNA-binding LacI/PurR family transcriptional regulator